MLLASKQGVQMIDQLGRIRRRALDRGERLNVILSVDGPRRTVDRVAEIVRNRYHRGFSRDFEFRTLQAGGRDGARRRSNPARRN